MHGTMEGYGDRLLAMIDEGSSAGEILSAFGVSADSLSPEAAMLFSQLVLLASQLSKELGVFCQ